MNDPSVPPDVGVCSSEKVSPHALSRFRQGDTTFEEFLWLIPDGEKADLLDGVIYVASPESTEHAALLAWLCAVLAGFVGARQFGTVYVSRVAYRIGAKRGPEPDLGFVPNESEPTRRRGYIDGPPALAIEIVSPDSVDRDYVQKRAIYEQAGVPEYWILDPDERRATFLVLDQGRYREVQPTGDMIHSATIPGMALDVRWFWSSQRPDAFQILQGLLQNPQTTPDRV